MKMMIGYPYERLKDEGYGWYLERWQAARNIQKMVYRDNIPTEQCHGLLISMEYDAIDDR